MRSGMTPDFILDNLLHYVAKGWVDKAGLLSAIAQIAWEFGTKSWLFCAGAGNPLIKGRQPKAM